MQNKTPIALIVFSNDLDNYLSNIETEHKLIEEALEHYDYTNRLKVITRSSVSIEELFRLFNLYSGRIVLFHFSGHADGKGLQFNQQVTQTETGKAAGIADLIGREANAQLKFVFLNGCSIIVQVQRLKAVGVPNIIATHYPISDYKAVRFSRAFYRSWAKSDKLITAFETPFTTLQQAFDDALAYLKMSYTIHLQKTIRGSTFEVEETEKNEPWELFATEPNWHLPNISYIGKYPKKLGNKPFILQEDKFLGRTTELETIYNRLFKQNSLLLLVNGEGGIGKTTLATKYYQRYETDYEYLIWIYAERGIMEAILTLEIPLELSLDQKLDQNQRFKAILNELHQLPKPSLLVIDNANDLEDVEKHHFQLSKFTNLHILLTSRVREFSHLPSHKVEHLPKKMARQLFKKYYPNHNDKDNTLLEGILEAIAWNTLVIELLAKTLHEINEFEDYSLGDLLADLQKKGLLNLSQSEIISTPYQGKNEYQIAKPEAIIAAMYDINQLNAEEQKLLANFAILPAENIPYKYLKILLTDFENLKGTLKKLSQKGWIGFNYKERSFKVSPVVQEVIKNKTDDIWNKCQNLANNLINELHDDKLEIEDFKYSDVFIRYSETLIIYFGKIHNDIDRLTERISSYALKRDNLEGLLPYLNISKKFMLDLKDNLQDLKKQIRDL